MTAAIASMDRTTQENAALVEDASRTAATLNAQAVGLLKSVSGFELGAREYGNAEEAVALVQAACEYARNHGRDVDGKLFIAEMARLARTRGSGWMEHKWAHPVTNEVLTKRDYVERAGDVLVTCGIYPR